MRYSIPHLKWGDSIINNATCNSKRLTLFLDLTATRPAIVRSRYSSSGIRVNSIAEGHYNVKIPDWVYLRRPGGELRAAKVRDDQPDEIAGCVAFLASGDSVSINGQCFTCTGIADPARVLYPPDCMQCDA